MMLFTAFPPQTFNPKKIYLEYSAALPLDLSPGPHGKRSKKRRPHTYCAVVESGYNSPASSYRQILFLPQKRKTKRKAVFMC
jgi:hypothetical protein